MSFWSDLKECTDRAEERAPKDKYCPICNETHKFVFVKGTWTRLGYWKCPICGTHIEMSFAEKWRFDQ